MALKRRKFRRALGERRYRKLFVIAVEGAVTEPQYFGLFDRETSALCIKCLRSKHSSPKQVLKKMRDHLVREALRKSDEAWLVVDKDNWSDEHLAELYEWSLEKENYGFALSNLKFELWLLLHFEDGKRISSSNNCSNRLKKRLPEYNKKIRKNQFSSEMIEKAILRAKSRDKPQCADWPRKIGTTTVYRLIERMLMVLE
ncbi:MAG: RloB domain-containing protein [Candidatus Sabulitectum sp.]|nr:RloB domain-containing protein [Candidatus Sabulitectum sp.]